MKSRSLHVWYRSADHSTKSDTFETWKFLRPLYASQVRWLRLMNFESLQKWQSLKKFANGLLR